MKVQNVKTPGRRGPKMMIHVEIHYLKWCSINTLNWIDFLLKRSVNLHHFQWRQLTCETCQHGGPLHLLLYLKCDFCWSELYQAERYMPSIYSMVVLSVHMFVKHRFKSHEFCNCVRNFWLPSNTYSPRRCNTVFTGTISSYTNPWKKCVCIFSFPTTWIYNDMSQEIK